MKIDILTLFPKMFSGPFSESIIKRAQTEKIVEINVHDLRDWANDNYKTVDDRMFGGGVGMLMKVDVIDKAVNQLKTQSPAHDSYTILLDARGKVFNQKKAVELSKYDHLIFICGHYEGVDYRIHENIADEVISIGDYILTGGEIPAMVIIDTTVRQIPGVIVKPEAIQNESFSTHNLETAAHPLLESPQYTRPEKYLGWSVPKVLLSGNHREIEKWQKEQSLVLTKKNRPELLVGKSGKIQKK